MIAATLFSMMCIAQTELLVLDNGAIRAEIDPAVFSVRYLGPPGGPNVMHSFFVDDATRQGDGAADPGGVIARISPFGDDPALVRGPAEVIDHRKHFIALLGVTSDSEQIRLKKEFRLDPILPKITYTVTVLSLKHEARRIAPQSVAYIPIHTIISGAGDDVFSIELTSTTERPPITPGDRVPEIRVPARGPLTRTLWRGSMDSIRHAVADVVWVRTSLGSRPGGTEYLGGSRVLCVLDEKTRVYSEIFQSPYAMLDASSPVSFTEEWTLEMPEDQDETDEETDARREER